MQVDHAAKVTAVWPGYLLFLLFLSLGFAHRNTPRVLVEGRDYRFDGKK